MGREIPDHELDAALTVARWRHGAAVSHLIEKFAGAGQLASAVPQERRLDLLRDLEQLAK